MKASNTMHALPYLLLLLNNISIIIHSHEKMYEHQRLTSIIYDRSIKKELKGTNLDTK